MAAAAAAAARSSARGAWGVVVRCAVVGLAWMAAAGEAACDEDGLADSRLRKWLYESEGGIGSGSLWLTLGGNVSAHGAALDCALRRAARSAVAPPIDTARVELRCASAACGEELARAAAAFVRARSGRYGVAVVVDAELAPTWPLKMAAAYFWGKTRCAHPTYLESEVDCSRLVWVLSTSFGSEALYRERARRGPRLDELVAAGGRRRWPSREAGSLAVKAPRLDRCAFVRGEMPTSLVAAIAAAHLARRGDESAADSGNREWLERRFVGQPGAVAGVAAKLDALRGPRLTGERRPAAFFFYGVAGVGKTRLGELVGEALGRRVVKVEMESFSAEEDANRLFGAPPGYGQGYSLVDELIESPRAVVVMDEIEKAHPSIFREKLHSLLSEGLARDKRDRTRVADVSEAVFVFTSNCFEARVEQLARNQTADLTLERYEALRDLLAPAVNDHPRLPCSDARPNPFDDASLRSRIPPSKQFPFFPLSAADRERLVDVELDRLASSQPRFALSWSPDVPKRYAATPADARATLDALNDDLEKALVAAGRPPSSSARAVVTLSHPASPWDAGSTDPLALTWIDDAAQQDAPLLVAWVRDDDLPPPLAYAPTPKMPPEPPLAAAACTGPDAAPDPLPDPAPRASALAATVLTLAVALALVRALLAAAMPVAALAATSVALASLALAALLGPRRAVRVAFLAIELLATAAKHLARLVAGAASPPALAIAFVVFFFFFFFKLVRPFRRSARPTRVSRGTMTDAAAADPPRRRPLRRRAVSCPPRVAP